MDSEKNFKIESYFVCNDNKYLTHYNLKSIYRMKTATIYQYNII